MEFMPLALAIRYGTPVVLLTLVIFAVINTVINGFLLRAVKDIKNGVIWADKFIEYKDGIEPRLKSLESIRNGKLK